MTTAQRIEKFKRHVMLARTALNREVTRNAVANQECVQHHLTAAKNILSAALADDDKEFWTWADCKGTTVFDRFYAVERRFHGI